MIRRICSAPLIGLLVLGGVCRNLSALDARDFVVALTAEVQSKPAQITLLWPAAVVPAIFTVSRKQLNESSWHLLASLPTTATQFADSAVVVGAPYEYEVIQASSDGVLAYGYIYAGIEVTFAGQRGRVVLIVDRTFASDLAEPLTRLASDLTGDGWLVARHDVAPSDRPPQVKDLIQGEYRSDPTNTKAVFLFGHVPVPYSGDLNPDMHAVHLGAWPADVYYGELFGAWPDQTVNDTGAEDPRNFNVPGDGKFDPTEIPGPVSLQVGRVDLSQLQDFTTTSEVDLLRRYLDKNHAFRHKLFTAGRQAIIRDNFGDIQGDAPAADAWRSFVPFFGAENVHAVDPNQFFPALANQSYLWAYGGGGGEYYQADTVGSTADFMSQTPHSVFYMLHGSYFGDWDSSGNFLRAALASPGDGLAAAWTGLPHWFFHPMALGENIGLCAILAQNNRGLYKNQVNLSMAQVHISLMGDPTLRMHIVAPVTHLTATATNTGVLLNWSPSADGVVGYHVFRADSAVGPFARLTRELLTAPFYTDASPRSGAPAYQVRAITLEKTSSGSYYNPSQGIFVSGPAGNSAPIISPLTNRTADVSSAPLVIPFHVSDAETPADQLVVSVTSSDTGLVPPAGLQMSGAESDRTLTITPALSRTGSTLITLAVSDGALTNVASFQFSVSAPLRILSIAREASQGAVTLEFAGANVQSYTVEASKNLSSWVTAGLGTTDTNALGVFSDPNILTNACLFYRIRQAPSQLTGALR